MDFPKIKVGLNGEGFRREFARAIAEREVSILNLSNEERGTCIYCLKDSDDEIFRAVKEREPNTDIIYFHRSCSERYIVFDPVFNSVFTLLAN